MIICTDFAETKEHRGSTPPTAQATPRVDPVRAEELKLFSTLTRTVVEAVATLKKSRDTKKERQPKTFADPKKQSWSLWIGQFDNHMRGESDEEKLKKLPSFLENAALEAFFSFKARTESAGDLLWRATRLPKIN